MSYLHSIPKSFSYAFSGIKTAIKNEPNFRVHLVVAVGVIVLAMLTKFTWLEWIILSGVIGAVLILELINTSLESIVNMISPGQSEGARIAKDTAAGAVVIGAIVAVVVGLLLFVPKLLG